jgi:NAD(P)-dependent dehydrogenase (short-subunit alcohol dehydrogenase family)
VPEPAFPSQPSLSPASSTRWWSEETVGVVTGANRGIGFEVVKRLADLGLTVVLTCRDPKKGLDAVQSLVTNLGLVNVLFYPLDISISSSINQFSSWIQDKFGGLDILVNNAAVTFNDIDENSVEYAETVINTNYYGSKLLTEALLPLFRRTSSSSRILNITSRLGLLNKLRNPIYKQTLLEEDTLNEEKIEKIVSLFLKNVKDGTWKDEGWPEVWTDYSVSKIALNSYSVVLANRYQGKGLSVNCFCPGFTQTAMTNGKGTHSATAAAHMVATLALLPPAELPTGKFYFGSSRGIHSRL